MKEPLMTVIPTQREVIDVFGGYNCSERIKENEFADMECMTGERYPFLSPMKERREAEFSISGEKAPIELRAGNKFTGLTAQTVGTTNNSDGFKRRLCVTQGGESSSLLSVDGYVTSEGYFEVDSENRVTGDKRLHDLSSEKKQFVTLGNYLYVFPDAKRFDLSTVADFYEENGAVVSNGPKWENLWAVWSGCDLEVTLCKKDGTSYEGVTESKPESPEDGDLWLDKSKEPHVLKQYYSSNEMWLTVATTYIKIKGKNIAKDFRDADGVKTEIFGFSETLMKVFDNKSLIILKAFHDDGVESGEEGKDDYLVTVGLIDEVYISSNISVNERPWLNIARTVPQMDFVFECGNRLWGCRYGKSDYFGESQESMSSTLRNKILEAIRGMLEAIGIDPEKFVSNMVKSHGVTPVNEIYASKLGDPTNWNYFAGTSMDSYAASCGGEGQWTGAINYMGNPIFFKEEGIHRVYGDFPANYQIQQTPCNGVQKGCGESLVVSDGRLIYKGRDGVYIFDGSFPEKISDAFGNISYSGTDSLEANIDDTWEELRNGASAGVLDGRYYLSAKSEKDGKWYMLLFDSRYGTWHKQDEIKARSFTVCEDKLYFIDCTNEDNQKIRFISNTDEGESKNIRWMAQTGMLGLSSPDKKYISRMTVRLSLTEGSRAEIFLEYDSSGQWEKVYSIMGRETRSFSVPIRPKRCDHFKMRIQGEGEVRIMNLTKIIEQGSDL